MSERIAVGTITSGNLSDFTAATVNGVDVLSSIELVSTNKWRLTFDDDGFPDEYMLSMTAGWITRAREYVKAVAGKIVVPDIPPYLNITPGSGFSLSGGTQTFTWTDPNAPVGRRYDKWMDTGIGFEDQGLSSTDKSWTVNGLPTDGRTIKLRVYYWDGDAPGLDANGLPNADYAETIYTAFDTNAANQGQASATDGTLTFAEIESQVRSRHRFFETEDYRAGALFLRPQALYATVDETAQTVTYSGAPDWTGTTTPVSTVAELRAQFAGAGNTQIDGQGNTYTVNLNEPISADNIELYNMTLRFVVDGAQLLHITGNNVQTRDFVIDGENRSIQNAIRVDGDDFNGMNSEIKNVVATGTLTNDMIRITGNRGNARGFKFTNLYGLNGAMRAIRMDGNSAEAGEWFNCVVTNLAAWNTHPTPGFVGNDGDAFVAQYINFTNNSRLRIYAARGVDAGKRLVKFQAENCEARFCINHWMTEDLPHGKQTKRAHVADIGGSNNVVANCFGISDHDYTHGESFGFVYTYNRGGLGSDNKRHYGNGYQINHAAKPLDYGHMLMNFDGDAPWFPTGTSRLSDNWIEGLGSIDRAWWIRGQGGRTVDAEYPNGSLDTANTVLVPVLRETVRND